MADRQRSLLDFIAWGLLLVGLVGAVALFSHEPGSATSYPSTPPANLLGPAGAWVSQELYEALGAAVHVLLAIWFVLVLMLLLRRGSWTWCRRLVGWLVLLPCAAVAADWVGPDLAGGTMPGSGGAVGAWLADWMEHEFPAMGRVALFAGCLFVGLLLTADVAVVWLLRGLWAILRGGFGLAAPLVRARQKSAPKKAERPSVRAALAASARAAKPDANAIPINYPVDVAALAAAATPQVPTPIVRPAPVSDGDRFADFELPPLTLLEDPQPFPYEQHDQQLRERAALLEKTFKDFDLNVRVVGINTGPVITQYEIALETGLRLNKVTCLADDIALNLRVPSVRIVAPIPGKNTVGVEIPNDHRAVVRLKEVILSAAKKAAKMKVPLFLGKDTEGRPLIYDLAEMPHLLIAGRTGTGKSVCMNAMILSMLMTRRPDEVKMIMIDPKMLELSEYGKIPHLMHPVVKDMKKAEAILAWAVDKMEERYDLLSRARVRNVASYNELSLAEIHRRVQPADDEERARIPDRMPFIVIIVDEMGDLMMTMKREVEGHIIRLAQKSRAAGIHLVVATQKPTVDVITGLIKSNLPARICFQVSSRSDSRVVLDEMGADKLLGKGDMLFLQPGSGSLIRSQGAYASDEEITRVVEHLECDEPCFAQELVHLNGAAAGQGGLLETLRARDDVYEAAIEVVIREGRGSVSLLQRSLGIGYGRAARLIDYMAEDGIVGEFKSGSAREVLYTLEEWEALKNGASPKDEAAA
jgi:DNA segregation ATPase FtsK/SpoIIIE, S-DNA-T family